MGNFESGSPAEEIDWDALARFLDGESTPEEAAHMRRWLDERPERAELVTAMQSALASLKIDAPSDLDVEGALRGVKKRFAEESQAAEQPRTVVRGVGRKKQPRWEPKLVPVWQRNSLRVAAAAVVVAGVGLLWSNSLREDRETASISAQRFATSVGERDSVRLPDGSRVVLGPGTVLTFAEGFGSTTREVDLRGEAYFDVVHDGSRPFTVHAGAATIVDVGTTFTVKSDDIAGVRVAVTSGAVRLRVADDSGEGALLEAGDVGMLTHDKTVVAARGAVSADDSAFTGGRLVFRDAPLTEVSAALSRWYGIELAVADSSLARRRLTATFDGEPVERVLSVIGLTLGVDVERRGATVIVRPPRQR